jgi:hypothetical protein
MRANANQTTQSNTCYPAVTFTSGCLLEHMTSLELWDELKENAQPIKTGRSLRSFTQQHVDRDDFERKRTWVGISVGFALPFSLMFSSP